MKISIATNGKDIDSPISELGGRAPFYLIFENGILLEAIKNPFVAGSGGAGFSVAYMLAEKGVSEVVAGEIGNNMKLALEDRDLNFLTVDHFTSVAEIIKNK